MIIYHQIREVVNHLESTLPTLLATYDLMSIDTFRRSFTNNAIIKKTSFCINNLKEINYNQS